jgi:hydroxypyruvate isomerase
MKKETKAKKKISKKKVVKLDKTLHKDQKMIAETIASILVHPTLTVAAENLKITRQALYDRIEKHDLRTILESIKTQAMDTLLMSSVKAAEKLVKEIDNVDSAIGIDVSKDILNRVNVKSDPKSSGVAVQVNNIIENASKEADEFLVDATTKN